MTRILTAAVVVLGLAVPVGAAQKEAAKQDRIPGGALWDFGAWADDYLVVATAYDPDTRQVTWTLEARRKVASRGYKATFFDPDTLELSASAIDFEPARTEYAKGARIKARVKLPDKEVMREVSRVRIDRQGDDPAPQP